MAQLTNQERYEVMGRWCDERSSENTGKPHEERRPLPGNKNALLMAVSAVDDWLELAQPSFLNALPEPFKSRSNGQEKAELFLRVLAKRMGRPLP